MAGSIPWPSGGRAGGIVSLAKAVMQYREAIDYDLLTKTGYELKDVGRTLSWRALDHFLRRAEPDSALMQELNPDLAEWSSRLKTNIILADIYDILAVLNANVVARGSGKPARRPKPYPRPGRKDDPETTRHIGSGALPPDELRAWIERKRAEYNARNSAGHNNGHPSP